VLIFKKLLEAYWHNWDNGVRNFVNWIKTPDKQTGRPYAGRYVGSLIADFHRNLLYGGIFLYPKGIKANLLPCPYFYSPFVA